MYLDIQVIYMYITPFVAQSAFVAIPESSSGVQTSSWSSLPFVAAVVEVVSYEGDGLGLLYRLAGVRR